MKLSDEQIHDILKIKDHILNEIEKYKQEIEMFEKNLGILNSVLKESSFTKASDLSTKQTKSSDLSTKQTKSDSTKIPLTRGSSGEIIANAYVTPTQVSIVLNDDIDLDENTPPLKSFFIDRIIADMKRKDSSDVQRGKIQPDSVINYVINKNGSHIREIIVKNYRQKDRVNEIINTAAWSFSRMIENTK
ncbi:MAG: hypothetical protein NPMRTHETA2_1000002 [Nitrosopumilales archaeon]|nr:MAG: hypothetical protein NPMRTHETA2_1000002 [Nitrosopumilales archaeon]